MRYAVAFIAHYWDAFVARQHARVLPLVPRGDLHVVTDETRGPVTGLPPQLSRVAITPERIGNLVGDIPREKGIVGLDSVVWYNLDIATAALFAAHPGYAYCVAMDYDVCLNLDLGRLMQRVQNEGLDFVGHSHPDIDAWSWAPPHRARYPGGELRGALVAVTIMSRRAASFLLARRRIDALEYAQGKTAFWPFCEAFMPSELARAGFRCGELGDYADVSRMRWRPVFPEAELEAGIPPGITHPVRPHGDADARYAVQP
jgi:hypothetical protein